MKRRITMLISMLAMLMLCFALASCGEDTPDPTPEPDPVTYTVTFINGTEVFYSATVKEGDFVTLPTEDPTSSKGEDYVFDGWFADENKLEENTVRADRDLVFVAKFHEEIRMVTLTFVYGEGDSSVTTLSFDSVITAPSKRPKKPMTERYQYVFEGWVDEDGVLLKAGDRAQRDMTFMPQFTEQLRRFTVTFYVSEGNSYDAVTVEYGGTYQMPARAPRLSDPDYYYIFTGWLDAEGKAASEEEIVTSDLEFFAQFDKTPIPEYTVTFMNGDKVERIAQLKEGEYLPAMRTPSREGFTFISWFDADGNELVPRSLVTGNATWYAAFSCEGEHLFICDPVTVGDKTGTPCYYCDMVKCGDGTLFATHLSGKTLPDVDRTVTFVLNGETVETRTVKNGAELGTLPADPVKTGQSFGGWMAEDGTFVSASARVLGDATIRAVFSCVGEHVFGSFFEVEGGELVAVPCEHCDVAQVYALAHGFDHEDGELLPLGSGGMFKPYEDDDDVIRQQIRTETDGNHYSHIEADGIRPDSTQFQTMRNAALRFSGNIGVITLRIRANADNTPSLATFSVVLSGIGNWNAVEDGEGVRTNNSTNGLGVLSVKGDSLYNGSESQKIATLSSEEWTEISVTYILDPTTKTAMFEYIVNGESVLLQTRANVQLTSVVSVYLTGSLKDAHQGFDFDDFAVIGFAGLFYV